MALVLFIEPNRSSFVLSFQGMRWPLRNVGNQKIRDVQTGVRGGVLEGCNDVLHRPQLLSSVHVIPKAKRPDAHNVHLRSQ
jgi:hypothetical protein